MAVVADAATGLRSVDRGATIVQLRNPRMSARELESEAVRLVAASSVPVLISARCDIALASGAAGVNLPERDIAVADARSVLPESIVGRSVHSLEGAREAERQGADFVIFGPVWASPTHAGQEARGLGALAEVARAVRIPVLAIGGVTLERAEECLRAGGSGYAAITMFR
jgi:thiamine-phosphate diphosphorylase